MFSDYKKFTCLIKLQRPFPLPDKGFTWIQPNIIANVYTCYLTTFHVLEQYQYQRQIVSN